ncbi:DUF159 domain protein [Beauveria bassiana ARSEF 2860]|uniref:DUF159 domain protein n=1 Tax=Beauveria bassiana (strain ARSEF 2860) TaxID=655819 RepID=J4KLV8_BEAB2|nr:DUF159 domain protein [Beauveria bassiana ARSEF 2860]EJP62879.1 DUF159 domain protein [Beauveria bassiana ARSEF 2860]
MCGRYALALRPSEIRQLIEDAGMEVADAPDDEGVDAPSQSYNFAPGYYGVVCRANTPDHGAGPATKGAADGVVCNEGRTISYRLQSMKWGLVPSWSKRNPDHTLMLKTINCRSDSLSSPGGIWATMKARKRCVVIAQGFYEWLKTRPKEKLPHYVKRQDGQLMCFAGLWDCVQFEGVWLDRVNASLLVVVLMAPDSDEKQYTFSIITTDSNKQLKFLHDRMPVIMEPGSDAMRRWLDPNRYKWTKELQFLLQPFAGDVEVYPVSKGVGKVGNNSPTFIKPLYSRENKSNIANFFSSPGASPQKSEDASTSNGPKVTGETRKLGAGVIPAQKKEGILKTGVSSTHNDCKKPTRLSKGTQKITNFFER